MPNNTVIQQRIASLRLKMKKQGIDAVIIPQSDPHQSEYLADHWQVRRFFSGFSGSAGSLVVTDETANLWTDSRYFIQAARQLEGTGIGLMKDKLPGTPTIDDYLCDILKKDQTIGIDATLFSIKEVESMRKRLNTESIRLVTDFDVVDEIWHDRPTLPKHKIFVHDEKYAGQPAADKIRGVLDNSKKQMAESAFISPLDEIAWTLNIRCRDVDYNPVATAYLYIGEEGSTLFIDPDKLTPETIAYLDDFGVRAMSYADVMGFIANLPGHARVLLEKATTSYAIASAFGDRAVFGESPVAIEKATKNAVQIDGVRRAMVRDGVALVKAFKEIEEIMSAGTALSELDVNAILFRHRSAQDLFFDESFGTITGYGPHGAIVHYEPDEESNAKIEPNGLLLVDSGAQYLDGTTDITRTICLGEPTPLERHDFTLVMKGHIALATMVFPKGTYGVQLDAEARKFLWREGLGYLHGTGHGVGHFLNVHEGPHQIRMNYIPATLQEGLLISDEPGLYRENIHGVRCENLLLCVFAMSTEFGDFLKFETMTLFPFDTKLFDTSIMSAEEIEWVNDYHTIVRNALSPYLSPDEKAWLESKTQRI